MRALSGSPRLPGARGRDPIGGGGLMGATGRTWSAAELARALEQFPPTEEQTRVIEAPLAPMLVIAGAGSGKTDTMAAKVVYLVANRRVAPEHVLRLSFPRKAAAELSDRIRARLPHLSAPAPAT